jgi:hypothetical protein
MHNSRTSISQLSDLDSRLQLILHRLDDPTQSHASPTPSCGGMNSSEPSSRRKQYDCPGADMPRAVDQIAQLDSSTGSCSWVTAVGLDMSALDQLLQQYRLTQHYFPFVFIRAGWTAASMLKDHGCLLLAAATTATVHCRRVQSALARTFRDHVAARMLHTDEQSLDLLQGMLVYLAWYGTLSTIQNEP